MNGQVAIVEWRIVNGMSVPTSVMACWCKAVRAEVVQLVCLNMKACNDSTLAKDGVGSGVGSLVM